MVSLFFAKTLRDLIKFDWCFPTANMQQYYTLKNKTSFENICRRLYICCLFWSQKAIWHNEITIKTTANIHQGNLLLIYLNIVLRTPSIFILLNRALVIWIYDGIIQIHLSSLNYQNDKSFCQKNTFIRDQVSDHQLLFLQHWIFKTLIASGKSFASYHPSCIYVLAEKNIYVVHCCVYCGKVTKEIKLEIVPVYLVFLPEKKIFFIFMVRWS